MEKLGTAPDIEKMYRVGMQHTNAAEQRPRGLVVWLAQRNIRLHALNKARTLKNDESWQNVFIHEDLTKNRRKDARRKEQCLKVKIDLKMVC
jgi:ribonucleotide monophosphatase NagD (HAD superfamily)